MPAHIATVYRTGNAIAPCYQGLVTSMQSAGRVQQAFIDLHFTGRQITGYKIGLSSPAAQAMLGIDYPLVGVLYRGMLVPGNSTVAIDSAARMLVELDLAVRVASDNINRARSLEEIAMHIDRIIPFIELPDTLFEPSRENAAFLLQATNVGARWGVTGESYRTVSPAETVTLLAGIEAVLKDDSGRVLGRGSSSTILGHPLNAVRFLLAELAEKQLYLRPGDIISLGAIDRPVPAAPGRTYSAEYYGLTASPHVVSVTISAALSLP